MGFQVGRGVEMDWRAHELGWLWHYVELRSCGNIGWRETQRVVV